MKNHLQGTLFSLMIALFIGLITYVPVQSLAANAEQFETSSTEAVIENYGSLPLYFEENAGQTDQEVRYFARAGGYNLFLTDNRIAFNLVFEAPSGRPDALDITENIPTHTYGLYLDFIGANPHPTLSGEAIQEGISSYFKGTPEEWVTDVSHYGAVRYQDLYNGIDAVFYGNAKEIQYDFIVAPHADPSQIRLNFDPVENISLAENGNLHLLLGSRTLTMNAPYTYQVIDGVEHAIESRFIVDGAEVSFALGQYDSAKPLVIDPVIVYAGYIGGIFGYGIAMDVDGNAYVTGDASSDFPVVGGSNLTFNSGSDAFVAKVNASGTELLYVVYIGGDSNDYGHRIAVDSNGNAYITGMTYSTETTFPVIGGPDLTHNGAIDAFVAKVNASGTALIYAGYIGGDSNDSGDGIAVDGNGNAYITGMADSTETTFPVIGGPDLTHNGGRDAFVAKVNASGTGLVYAGYIGGNGNDSGRGIAVDNNNNAYITGTTSSAETTFPVIIGPDLGHNGGADAFVAKVNSTGTGLIYAGYIGGNNHDQGLDIAIDSSGNAYVTGFTNSTELSFPVKIGPDLTFNGGSNDAFTTKVNEAGSGLVYSGYIGGNNGDAGTSIAVDNSGNAYVAGETGSTETTFPVTVGPDLTHNGGEDAFVVKINSIGTGLTYGSYIGGTSSDGARAIAVDSNGNAYIAGRTSSTETSFPVTVGPNLSYGSAGTAFIAKIGDAPLPSSQVNITALTAQHPDIPSGNWINLPDMKTFDGNNVKFTVSLANTYTTPQSAMLLNLMWGAETLASEPFVLSPNASQNVSLNWDTLNRAWTSNGLPAAPYSLTFQLITSGNEVLASSSLTVTVRPRPVVLVHGFNSDAGSWSSYTEYFQLLHPEWIGLAADNLLTGSLSFENAVVNAYKLHEYITTQQSILDAQHIDLVGHSMGGLISRAYLHGFGRNAADGKPVVFRLLTLGTPHLGSPCADIGTTLNKLVSYTIGGYHFTTSYMALFNLGITNTNGTAISALAGSHLWTCGGWGDLVVPDYSALAYGVNNLQAPVAAHVELLLGIPGVGDYVTSVVQFVNFVLPRLSAPWTGPANDDLLSLPRTREELDAPPVTQQFVVNIPAGQTVTQTLRAYGSGGLGVMFPPTQGLATELRDDSDTLIMALDANMMTLLPMPTLSHENAAAGTYTVRLTNVSGSPLSVPMVVFEDELAQTLRLDAVTNSNGIQIIATVTDTGVRVAGTTVTGEIRLVDSDSPPQTINLFDDGLHGDGAANDGVYAAQVTPSYAGLYVIIVTAQTPSVTLTKSTVVESTAGNQLINGSFETRGNTARLAQGWKVNNPLTGDRRFCVTPTRPLTTADGICVFQFRGGSATQPARNLRQTIIASGWGNVGDTLTLSAQVSGNNFKAGARLILRAIYTDNSIQRIIIPIPAGSYPYTTIVGSLPLTKPLMRAVVIFDIKRVGGRLRVDDVNLSVNQSTPSIEGIDMPLTMPEPDMFRGIP